MQKKKIKKNTVSDILKKEDLQWSARHAASFAIKRLLMSDIKNCSIFLNIHGPVIILIHVFHLLILYLFKVTSK